MSRQKRYTKRRRSHRKTSRKMRGGLGTPNDESLHLSDLNVTGQSGESNVTGESLPDWENSGFSGDTTINSNDWSIGQQAFGNIDIDTITQDTEDNHILNDDDLNLTGDQSANTTMEDNSVMPGGKRKPKRRTSSKKSKKTKKSRKTRKHRKRRQRGGVDTQNMTTEYLNVNDRDKKDYDQMLNTLNWNPKQ